MNSVDECWVVFDRDKNKDFDRAIDLARKEKLKIAYSNECFELWLLLHFKYTSAPLCAKEYIEKLNSCLSKVSKKKYTKSMKNIHELICEFEANAIKNAEKLMRFHAGKNIPISKKNPSTTVHLLVKRISEVKSKG